MSGRPPGELGRTSRTTDELFVVNSGARSHFSRPTTCRLRLYRPVGRDPVALVTELAWNRGPSITNVAESVWRAVAELLGNEQFVLVEHYGPESYTDGTETERHAVVTVDRLRRGGICRSSSCTGWWAAHSRRPVPSALRWNPGVPSLLREAAVTLRNPPIPRWGH